jgi:hypothetical protein
MSDNSIEWTRPKLEEFKQAYEAAQHADAEAFRFEGHDIVTVYAKYLIEYLESQLGERPWMNRSGN